MPKLNREQIIAELQEIIDHFAGSLNRYWTLSNALDLIKQLTEENEKLVQDVTRLAQAKTEVAREIFEEIEKIINQPFAVGFDLLSPLKQALGDYNNGIRKDLLYYIADLKKKYIGEEK